MTHLGNIGDIAVVVGPIFIWFVRWARKLETAVGLAHQTSKEHLPFIYGRLRKHDNALGLATPEHPNIGFVNGTAQHS